MANQVRVSQSHKDRILQPSVAALGWARDRKRGRRTRAKCIGLLEAGPGKTSALVERRAGQQAIESAFKHLPTSSSPQPKPTRLTNGTTNEIPHVLYASNSHTHGGIAWSPGQKHVNSLPVGSCIPASSFWTEFRVGCA